MDDDNVIYVQVDEHGRVVNYTSNTSIGDQLILLQEGQDGQVVMPTQPSTTQATTTPTSVQQVLQPSTQPTSKPTIINLGSNVTGLTSNVHLVGATKSTSQVQSPTGVRVAGTLPSTMSHLSSVHTITAQSPHGTPTRLTLSPQKVTISPQRMTINPKKITISPQNIRKVIGGTSFGSPVGQIRISSPQQKLATQSIITPSGVKQVSLLGSVPRPQSKITIKSVGGQSSPKVERISLDQLVSSGAITLQKLPSASQIPSLRGTHVISVNSPTQPTATVTSQPIVQHMTSPRTDDVVTERESVAYAKPDTTTDEASLLIYQAPQPQVAISEKVQVSIATDAMTGNAKREEINDDVMMTPHEEQIHAESAEVTAENTKNYVSDLCVMNHPSSADEFTLDAQDGGDKQTTCKVAEEAESLDETLENYLAGDSNIALIETVGSVAKHAAGRTETDMELGDSERKQATGRVQSDEEDEFDELPAGLIRGEPVYGSSASKSAEGVGAPEKGGSKYAEDTELVPIEIDHITPRKRSRLPLVVQSASDTDSTTDNESMPLLQPEDIPGEAQIIDSEAAPVLSRSRGRKSKDNQKKETPEETGKKDFMKKNFGLLSQRDIEEKMKRRSARVSNAEHQKQADAELEHDLNPKETSSTTTPKQTDTQTDETETNRLNIFDIFGNTKEDTSPSDNPNKYINKLQTVNTELKSRLKSMEQRMGRSPPNKYREKSHTKMMEAKLVRFEKINEDLLLRLQEYEMKEHGGKPSPPERKVDTTFKHGKFTFSPAGPSKRDPLRWEKFEFDSGPKQDTAAITRKEAKIKALHHELDMRTAILKAKESKLQRLVTEVKDRENKVEYKEHAIQRRVQDIEYRERILEGKTKAAIEKRNKQEGGNVSQDTDDIRSKELLRFEMEQREKDLKRREADVKRREQEAERKEELLKMTEKQLEQLHDELKQEYEQKQDTVAQGSKRTGAVTGSRSATTTPKSEVRGRRKIFESKSEGKTRSQIRRGALKSPLHKNGSGRRLTGSPWSDPVTRKDLRLSGLRKSFRVSPGKKKVPRKSPKSPVVRKDRRGRPRKPKPEKGVEDESESDTESSTPETTKETKRRSSKKYQKEMAASEIEGETDLKSPETKKAGRGRPRKTPQPGSQSFSEAEATTEDQIPTTSASADSRVGKKSRKSTGDTPKSVSKFTNLKEIDSKIETNESETNVSDNEEPQADEYEFESETESGSAGVLKGRSGTKADSLKKPLKSTKKPHGGAAVLGKRSRSHSESPAPSESKKHKSE